MRNVVDSGGGTKRGIVASNIRTDIDLSKPGNNNFYLGSVLRRKGGPNIKKEITCVVKY